MGNRQHRENILNPTCDLDYLNSCYKITENIAVIGLITMYQYKDLLFIDRNGVGLSKNLYGQKL